MGERAEIAMLWMEGPLSYLERLCIRSFLDQGHPVTLYSYGPVDGVPDGVRRADAGDIVPRRRAILHSDTGSPAPHADMWRYRLLAQRPGVVWADTDAYCAAPFAPRDGHYYGWESAKSVNIGVLALPPDSPTLRKLIDFTSDEYAIPYWLDPGYVADLRRAAENGAPVHVGDQVWAVWGPKAFTQFLTETGEIDHALPQDVLYPFGFRDRRKMARPGFDVSGFLTGRTASIHLYGRRMRRFLVEKHGGVPPADSLLGRLLERHGIDPAEAPLPGAAPPEPAAPQAPRSNALRAVDPAPPPRAAVRPLRDVVAVTTMRNEGAFILDWIAHHLSVGIAHFLVYTNDCDDPTDAILDALAARGLVTREDNAVAPGARPQRQALARAVSHPRLTAADAWVVMDVDEFIDVHAGQGTLVDLFAAAGDPDLISMTWRFFGCNGHIDYADDPAPLRFTRAAPHVLPKPHQAWGFKTIVRRGAPFAALGVHRPLAPTGPMPRWTNGSGRQMPDDYRDDGWRSTRMSWGYDLVTLNHYAVRSVESFLVKRDRGRTNHVDRDQGADYWRICDRNDEEATSILPRWSRAEPIRGMFRADPELSRLHEDAVAWHCERARTLKRSDAHAALYDELKVLAKGAAAGPGIARPTAPDPGRASPGPPPAERDGRAPPSADDIAYRKLIDRVGPRHPPFDPLPRPLPAGRIVVVTSMKNEGAFILEWIAHHVALGVGHFLVYTNDCEDGTVEILDRLAALGLVTRRDNPFDPAAGQKPQRAALNDAATQAVVRDADWAGVIDVDEFVNLHRGIRTLPELFRAMNDPNVVSMTWRTFGNDGRHRYRDEWITGAFHACAPRYLPKPRLGWGFKSFRHRTAPFGKLGVHRPLELDREQEHAVRWVNGSGRRMPDHVAPGKEWFSRKSSIGYGLVTLNHYVLRSAESFLVKRQRGRINHVDQDQGLAYWAARNYRSETDRSIEVHHPAARAQLARLMADDTLARLHAEAVDWHRRRIAALLAEPDYRALYDAITDPALPDAVLRGADGDGAATDLAEAI